MTGLEFERECLTALSRANWWAYRCNPDRFGSQPFDIIAAFNGNIAVYDCKVVSTEAARFDFRRIEANQRTAFELFLKRNPLPYACGFLVWYKGQIYYIPYGMTLNEKSIKLSEDLLWTKF